MAGQSLPRLLMDETDRFIYFAAASYTMDNEWAKHIKSNKLFIARMRNVDLMRIKHILSCTKSLFNIKQIFNTKIYILYKSFINFFIMISVFMGSVYKRWTIGSHLNFTFFLLLTTFVICDTYWMLWTTFKLVVNWRESIVLNKSNFVTRAGHEVRFVDDAALIGLNNDVSYEKEQWQKWPWAADGCWISPK